MEQPKTAEEIVKILHSITKVELGESELDVWFDSDNFPCVSRSFVPGSFTRELLELIEKHMTPLLPECPHCGAGIGFPCLSPNMTIREPHKVRENK